MNRKSIVILFLILLGLSACSLGGTPTVMPPSATPTHAPTPSRTLPAATVVPTVTPLPPVPTSTATLGPAMLILSIDHLCNIGPGANYIDVVEIPSGTVLPIIGTNGGGWWLVQINDPRTPYLQCWIGGGTPTGDTKHLPVPAPGLYVPVHDESHWATLFYMDCSSLERFTWVWNGSGSGMYVTDTTFHGITGRPTIFYDEWIGLCPSFRP